MIFTQQPFANALVEVSKEHLDASNAMLASSFSRAGLIVREGMELSRSANAVAADSFKRFFFAKDPAEAYDIARECVETGLEAVLVVADEVSLAIGENMTNASASTTKSLGRLFDAACKTGSHSSKIYGHLGQPCSSIKL